MKKKSPKPRARPLANAELVQKKKQYSNMNRFTHRRFSYGFNSFPNQIRQTAHSHKWHGQHSQRQQRSDVRAHTERIESFNLYTWNIIHAYFAASHAFLHSPRSMPMCPLSLCAHKYISHSFVRSTIILSADNDSRIDVWSLGMGGLLC